MEPSMMNLGLGAAVALLFLERVYVLVKMVLENTGKKNGAVSLVKMQQQIHDLHQWHAKTDDEGVMIWYSRRSVEKAVEKIANTQETVSRLLEHLVRIAESQAAQSAEMQRTLADLYTNMTSYRENTCPFRDSFGKSKSEGSSQSS